MTPPRDRRGEGGRNPRPARGSRPAGQKRIVGGKAREDVSRRRRGPEPALDLTQAVLYRDDALIVIDKPAGLPVHAGPKGGLTVEDAFPGLRFGLPWDPALGHRLDKDTSGCLVLGRDRKALARLGKLFQGNRVKKTYWAIVEGQPPADEGRIALSLSKREKARGWHMRVDPKGQPAETFFRVLGRSERFAWLELKPTTGRTHQLRVHCCAKGWPILGDPIYGAASPSGPRLHLHARAIEVPFGTREKPVHVVAPVPAEMADALKLCGWRGERRETGGA